MVSKSVNPDDGQNYFLEDTMIEGFLKLIDEINIFPRKDDDGQFIVGEDLKDDEKSSHDYTQHNVVKMIKETQTLNHIKEIVE